MQVEWLKGSKAANGESSRVQDVLGGEIDREPDIAMVIQNQLQCPQPPPPNTKPMNER